MCFKSDENVAIVVGTMKQGHWNARQGRRRMRWPKSGLSRAFHMQQLLKWLSVRMVLVAMVVDRPSLQVAAVDFHQQDPNI
jgi:hypothetical protein